MLGLRFFGLLGLLLTVSAAWAEELEFSLPPGFSIEQVASVPKARSMVWGEQGTLFVSTQFSGKVYAVKGVLSGEPEVITLLDGLKISNGIAFRKGDLYVAESKVL